MSTQNERELARDRLAEAIGGDAFDCTRVWSAWGAGTMSEDDFVPIINDDNRIDEILDHVCAPLLSHIAELEKQVAEFETKWDETDAALAEAESRIDALSKDAEWQPIETAPRDCAFLGYQRVNDDIWCIAPMYLTGVDYLFLQFHSDNSEHVANPTHWKPIPKPPAIDAAISEREGE